MKTIFIICGPSGSGKTTIAEHLSVVNNWQIIEGDQILPSFSLPQTSFPESPFLSFPEADFISSLSVQISTPKSFEFVEKNALSSSSPLPAITWEPGGISPLTDEHRRRWLGDIMANSIIHLSTGTDVVVVCSALKRKYRDILREVLKNHNDKEHGGINLYFLYLKMSEAKAKFLVGCRELSAAHYPPAGLVRNQYKILETPNVDEYDCMTIDADQDIGIAKIAAEDAVRPVIRHF